MPRRTFVLLLLIALPLWLAACYGLRFELMEDARWVGLCAEPAGRWECGLRSQLGWLIHFGVFGKVALAAAVLAFCVPGRIGRALSTFALFSALLALVLYNAGLAVFAVVTAGLRLVRAPTSASGGGRHR